MSVSKEVLREELTYIWQTYSGTLMKSLDNDVFSKLCYAISPVLVGVSPQEIDQVFEEIGALKVRDFSYGGPSERELVEWIEPTVSSHTGYHEPKRVEPDLADGLESGSVAIAMLFMAKYGAVVKMFSEREQLQKFYYETLGDEVGFVRGAGISLSVSEKKFAGAWESGLDCRSFSQVLFALSKMGKVRVVDGTHLIWDPTRGTSERFTGHGPARGGASVRGGSSRGRGAADSAGRGSGVAAPAAGGAGAGAGGGERRGRLDEVFERRGPLRFTRRAFTDPEVRQQATKWQLHKGGEVRHDTMDEIIQAYLEYCHKYLIHPTTRVYLGPN